MDGIRLTPLKQIFNPKGDVFHAMKKSDAGFVEFGEAYFSTVNKGDIKGWKKHTLMTMNLVVPIGSIEFVIYNEKVKEFYNVVLSASSNYQRLSVTSGLWMSFRGVGDYNMLLNLASMEHDPAEAVNIDISEIKYAW